MIPKEVKAFVAMRAVENVLREIIIEELSAAFGSRWQRTQVSEDVLQKFRDAIVAERRYPWLQLVHHHPIYYTDFPDLRKIIFRNDNWTKVFQDLFGRNRDVFLGMLTELEPLRNSIAHNRAISAASVDMIESASERLRTALGARRFETLAARSTFVPDVYEILSGLRQEGEVASDRMKRCEHHLVLEVWQQAKDQWWFEDSYLGADLEPIRAFFSLAHEYRALPRFMGDGYRVERWLTELRFQQLAEAMRSSWEPLRIPGSKL